MVSPKPGRPLAKAIADIAFGIWFGCVFTVASLCCVMIIAILPGLARRKHVVAGFARSVFILTGSLPRVANLGELPDGPMVVVANHASYLDGVLLTAVLPARFSFVIKSEMSRVPLAGFLLRRIDSFFVDRGGSGGRSARQTRQIITAAKQGRALGFFPEGTFRNEAGLLKFYSGAFAAAAAGDLPLVPCAITGTRAMLSADARLPRIAPLTVTLLPKLEIDATAAHPVRDLRDRARAAILAACAEPDAIDVTLPAPGAPAQR
ncbi:MAG: lysophospholipid acyltransferase family protein [Pseudomonadota bacterium]